MCRVRGNAAGWAVRRGWVPWRDRRVLIALVIVGLGLTGLRARLDARWPPTGWVVLACDVGQGDGLLLRRPGASDALLVDTGPEPGPIAACLADSGVSRLVVLLTHYHADHTGGLETVLAGWSVEQVLVSAVDQPPGDHAAIKVRAPILSSGQSLSCSRSST